MDWCWQQEEAEGDHAVGRYGHSAVSIHPNHVLMIGGKTGIRGQIQVYLLSRNADDILTWRQLNVSPDQGFLTMTQRWAMASCFVEEKQFVFLHGGFDSEYNYGDTWLLKSRHRQRNSDTATAATSSSSSPASDRIPPFMTQLNNLRWCRENNTPPRAYHTAVVNKSIVYVFGGQCCVGGPYEHYNALLAFDFSSGPLKINPIATTGNGPSPRSQCSSVIYDNAIYILFGYTETQTLDDVYRLDLNTKQWEKICLRGDSPKCFRLCGIEPQPFRVLSSCRPTIQFSHRLIVLHPVGGAHREQGEVLTLSEINLKSKTWRVLNMQRGQTSSDVNISSRGNPTMTRLGDKLIVLGGHSQHQSLRPPTTMSDLLVTAIPRRLDWDRERLIWLGHLKGGKSDCNLAKLPPEMITLIIQFINGAAFI